MLGAPPALPGDLQSVPKRVGQVPLCALGKGLLWYPGCDLTEMVPVAFCVLTLRSPPFSLQGLPNSKPAAPWLSAGL